MSRAGPYVQRKSERLWSDTACLPYSFPYCDVRKSSVTVHFLPRAWPALDGPSSDPCPRNGPWTFGHHRNGDDRCIVNKSSIHM
eukprot:scaffold18583_cov160-Amphora_coffeaeformis.AAC.6